MKGESTGIIFFKYQKIRFSKVQKKKIYEEMKDIRTKELILILSINQRTKSFLNQAISFKCLCFIIT